MLLTKSPAALAFASIWSTVPLQAPDEIPDPYPHASLLGHAVANVGDLDGDGVVDWAASAPQAFDEEDRQVGAVVFFSGATDQPFRTVFGPAGKDYFGWTMWCPGDVNGDDLADLLVGSFSTRRFCTMISGADGSTFWTAQVPCLGPAWIPDVDGDGLLDIHLKYGRSSVVLDRNGRQLSTEGLYGALDLIPVGDLDGVPGAEMARQAGASVELLSVVRAEDGSRRLEEIASLELWGGERDIAARACLVADLDGSPGGDLVVGLPGVHDPGAGFVLAYSAPDFDLLWGLSGVDVQPDGPGESDFGTSLAVLPDITGDGRAEIAIGTPGHFFDGFVCVVSGADGRVLWTRRSQSLNDAEDYPGTSLDSLPDRDGDGHPELLVGGGCTRPHGWWCLSGNVQILSGLCGEVLFRIQENEMPELRRPHSR